MIPKIIHYCWLGGNPLPESAKKCIESWKKFCPDYQIIEWNEGNLNFETAPDFVTQAYEAKAWGFVPDYFRLWIIYNYGGIYLDTDVQMIKSFDPLLNNDAFAGFESEDFINFGVGFGAEKDHHMIKEHMELYEHISFLNEDGSLNRTPSPKITTDWLATKGLALGRNQIETVGGLTIYPKDYFAPKSFDTGVTRITKNTYSIHQYDASWFTEEEKLQYKKNLRNYKIQKITKFPNRVLMNVLGQERYHKIKKIIKGK